MQGSKSSCRSVQQQERKRERERRPPPPRGLRVFSLSLSLSLCMSRIDDDVEREKLCKSDNTYTLTERLSSRIEANFCNNNNRGAFSEMDIELPKNDDNDNRCTPSSHSDLLLNSNSTEASNETPPADSNTLNNVADNGVTDKQKDDTQEKVEFKVVCNKNKIDVTFPLDGTIAELKDHLQSIVSIPTSMQKILIKGIAKDDQTLRSIGVTKGAKVMVVGSKIDDVLAVSVPTKQDATSDESGASAPSKEPLSQQKLHRKILDKGIPDDVMPGILDSQEALPDFPLAGMLNKSGGKVRLTFKLEQDQLWIGTKERTDKIPMTSIKDVVSEPIHDHPEYHVMAIQLGTTDASKYWIYWVPSQYVSAIKEAVLGKWCFF